MEQAQLRSDHVRQNIDHVILLTKKSAVTRILLIWSQYSDALQAKGRTTGILNLAAVHPSLPVLRVMSENRAFCLKTAVFGHYTLSAVASTNYNVAS